MARTDAPADDTRSKSVRLRLSVVLAALAVVATLLAGCGSSATAERGAGTTPSATTAPTATPTATATSTPSRFVCANPAGSTLTYAYNDPSGSLMEVTGCSTPRLLISSSSGGYPIAWSATNRYLVVSRPRANGGGNQFAALDLRTLGLVPTRYGSTACCPVAPVTERLFVGWPDDKTFLGELVNISVNNPSDGPFTIMKVDLQRQQETKVATILWAADLNIGAMQIRGNGAYLFYGGYQSKTEGGAYLQRITLASGTDTKLVPLGYAGPGVCQAGPPCNWTTPWDVSPDGTHVVYHSPGPTRGPSDVYQVPDTPLVYAHVDGSSPSKAFGTRTAVSSTTPTLSPPGSSVVATFASFDPRSASWQTAIAAVTGGAAFVNRPFAAWRGDSAALLLLGQDGDVRDTVLYSLPGGAILQLQALAANYLWAN